MAILGVEAVVLGDHPLGFESVVGFRGRDPLVVDVLFHALDQ